MNGLTLAKYVLALGGVAVVLAADRLGVPWLGWVGLGLIIAAFLLRFWRRGKDELRKESGQLP